MTSTTATRPAWTTDDASTAQLGFLDTLITDRDAAAVAVEVVAILMDRLSGLPLTKGQASDAISALKACPRRTTLTAAAAPAASTKITQDGMYQRPDGVVVKVQVAVHGSGNLYAKVGRIVPEGERRTVRGKEVALEFDFTPGAMATITPAMRMSLEQAKAFGALYGCCCNCGATLTDETSIEAGIGPVCGKRFA